MTDVNLVSVIVPVYNVRGYLAECFDSICDQTHENIEIILVDDGSTDGSGELCDELASRDMRARVVHKANGGLSDARNAGLRAARGEWVSFVDSDDYVSQVFIEALLCAALETGCKISAVPFGRPFKDGEACGLVESLDCVPPAEVMESRDVQRLMLYQALDTGAPWRLYERGTLGEDPFPVGLYYEDLASVYKIIHGVQNVSVIDCRELYAYRMRGDSIIRQDYRHLKGESALRISRELYANISAWYPELRDAAASRCFSVCRMVFAQLPLDHSTEEVLKDREALWSVLSNNRRSVLFDSGARKRERFSALVAYLGKHAFWRYCNVCRELGLMR